MGTTFGLSVVNFFANTGETYCVRGTGLLSSVGQFNLVLSGPACTSEPPAPLTIRFPKGRPASVPSNVIKPVTVRIKPGSEQVEAGGTGNRDASLSR